jgi:hypothetical protein
MTNELEKKLFEQYPIIFRDRNKSMMETCMCWGICTDDGWGHLLDHLCRDLTSVSKKYDIKVIADQVKEKYGTLRFYYHIELGDRWFIKDSFVSNLSQKCASRFCRRGFFWLYRLISKIRKYFYDRQYELDGSIYHCEMGEKTLVYNLVYQEVNKIVAKYEDFSEIVCELCGKPAEMHCRGGWFKTLCLECGKNGGYKVV